MKRVWVNRRKTPKKKKPSAPKITVSEAHKSIAPLHTYVHARPSYSSSTLTSAVNSTAPASLTDSCSPNEDTGESDYAEDEDDGAGDDEVDDDGADDAQASGDGDTGFADDGGSTLDQIWDLGTMYVAPADGARELGAGALPPTTVAAEVEAIMHGAGEGERRTRLTTATMMSRTPDASRTGRDVVVRDQQRGGGD
ncbi:hypothetical protein NMY22_g18644 [Coprinellus aureogranulatus]|nr:hypothetical protein NMY22_g18644 [Coprinellus aureogranulatus]